jgi:hypothetical protein
MGKTLSEFMSLPIEDFWASQPSGKIKDGGKTVPVEPLVPPPAPDIKTAFDLVMMDSRLLREQYDLRAKNEDGSFKNNPDGSFKIYTDVELANLARAERAMKLTFAEQTKFPRL